MIYILILLNIIILAFIYRKSTQNENNRCLDGSRLNKPFPKDYGNYYLYLLALDKYKRDCYLEYLDRCKKGEEIFIEQKYFEREIENRISEYENLMK